MRIPELYGGESRGGRRHYRLRARRGLSNFLPGLSTPTIGINGDYLGPTLRLRRGEDVAIQVENSLGEPTTLHWHGLHVPARADGGPHQLIEDGAVWNSEFSVMQPAGTFWYHSHLLNRTGDQVYRGLAGMIILEDEQSQDLGLPTDYGVDDIPLVVQDRRFNADGSLRYVQMHRDIMTGLLGETMLVNGTHSPLFTPTTSRVRFRVLNGCNARSLNLAFDDNRPFQLVSSDGGLLGQPLEANEVLLAPAERIDIVADFGDGQPARLISKPLPANSEFAPRGMMRNMHPMNLDSLTILTVEPQSSLLRSDTVAPALAALRPLPENEAVRERRFVLGMAMGMGMGGGPGGRGRGPMGRGQGDQFFINGSGMDMAVINERVAMGDTEIWRLSNDTMMMHPFHIHHGQFRILDRDGRPPAPWERGYKDTVKVGPGQTLRFIMRFENFADSENPYMYHCHILEHEDNGMMGQFVVE